MLSFACEPLTKELLDQASPLIELHSQEIFQEAPFIKKDFYLAGSEMGIVKVFTMKEDDVLIGYAVYLVSSDPHFENRKTAAADAIYISKENRGKHLGSALIQYAEEYLKELGVHSVSTSASVRTNFGALLSRFGYQHTENVYRKVL